jgi:hypothetical protein
MKIRRKVKMKVIGRMKMEVTYDYRVPNKVSLAPEEKDLTGESVVRLL